MRPSTIRGQHRITNNTTLYEAGISDALGVMAGRDCVYMFMRIFGLWTVYVYKKCLLMRCVYKLILSGQKHEKIRV